MAASARGSPCILLSSWLCSRAPCLRPLRITPLISASLPIYLTLLGAANYVPGGRAPGSNPGNLVYAIAADAAGDAYIAGSTSDPNFPATPSAFQPKLSLANPQTFLGPGPPSDAFVAKLDP